MVKDNNYDHNRMVTGMFNYFNETRCGWIIGL